MQLPRNQTGALAESAIEYAAHRAGVAVYRPMSGLSRADMIFERGSSLWRVQVKWGSVSSAGDVVVINLSTRTLTPSGYTTSTYSADEIDLFAVYCGDLDRAFLLPVALVAGRTAIYLRLAPPRNNQRACTNLADQYDFSGAIAQLEERVAGSHEVRGSIPLGSTKSPARGPAIVVGSNPFRDKLSYWMDVFAARQELMITRHGRPRLQVAPIDSPNRQSSVPGASKLAPVTAVLRHAELFA